MTNMEPQAVLVVIAIARNNRHWLLSENPLELTK